MVQFIDSFRVEVKLVFILMYVAQRASAALSLPLTSRVELVPAGVAMCCRRRRAL